MSNEAGWRALAESCSPYLSGLLHLDADAPFESLLAPPGKSLSTQELMHELRERKRQAALVIAAHDLRGAWDDVKVMQALSRFADFCVQACLAHLLREARAQKKIKLENAKDPQQGCGVSVIALGKWGAHELNYSSDIDFMVIYDADKSPVKEKEETQQFFVRLTRNLARMLDQPEGNGYVFRTDLRLRPDPGAMPLAVSIAAAEAYYGSLGQNWERAAMIKARPVAGDPVVGADFMKIMAAWIWRKNLDFAAIQDIHSIKRQINAKYAQKPGDGNMFLDYNVKLGHGGIREIEFFAQTQQLVFGGREPALRAPETLEALKALAQTGHISKADCRALTESYLFLRRVEHRLQMREDMQTHSLPANEEEFNIVTRFLGYTGATAFIADLERHTGQVKKLYAGLFTESPSLAGPGNLVFTGVEDDPETLETLAAMGFREPRRVTAAVRGWHHGRTRAVRSERARQILTELVPHLLATISKTAHPDDAFARFDAFLGGLPAGIPLFSLFLKNPDVMALVADIMGDSPAMAEFLGAHPEALDGVLTQDFFGALPDTAWLKKELARLLDAARDYEHMLDIARRFTRERRFHAGIHILKNLSPDADCRRYFADIAEAALSCLLPRVEGEFAKTHGTVRGGAYVILGLGSFGARQMFSDSDLDLVALYDAPDMEKPSTGKKPLPPNVYYIRLTQRLVSALSAPTAEGVMYDADLRLRPDGDKGPLAVSFEGFFKYHKNNAWVWEHMSLVRARAVCGPAKAQAHVQKETAKILSAKRHEKALRLEMADMREKVEKQFGSKDPWRLKYARGGMMDVMFVAHYHALKNAHLHGDILSPNIGQCLDNLYRKKLIPAKDYKALARAYSRALNVNSFLRLCAELPFSPETATRGLKEALVRRALLKGEKPMPFRAFSTAVKKDCAESYKVFRKTFG